MKPVRLRIAFEDRHVLGKCQRREGLKRCWVLLRPELDTVGDLASHIIDTFSLQDSCPSGLVLSMDRFVLPSFESTGIFKDKDVLSVRVRKRETEALKLINDVKCSKDSEITVKQHSLLCDSIVAAEESEKESGGYQSEAEEDEEDQPVVSVSPESTSAKKAGSKRKRDSDRHPSSKRKKPKVVRPVEYPTDSPTAEDDPKHDDHHSREDCNKQHTSSRKHRSKTEVCATQIHAATGKSMDHPMEERCDEIIKRQTMAVQPDVSVSNKKTPSRSSRRKKLKRQWLRQHNNSEIEKIVQKDVIESGTPCEAKAYNSLNFDSDSDEVVPVVVKPGHIRFKLLGESEQPSNKSVETLKWIGTVDKKKGQKWGRERNFNGRMDDINLNSMQLSTESVCKDDGNGAQLAEFEKHFPLTRLPKEGDILAYRVVELSSSWCPELSSFRVGKVTTYDPSSKKIILVQVPDYPIFLHEGAEQMDRALYNEDGSLEVDFPSLHDVRVINDEKTTMAGTSRRESTGVVSSGLALVAGLTSGVDPKANRVDALSAENKQCEGWEELCQALDAKKTQLSQRNGWACWKKKEPATKSTPSSFRALRLGALGPTISLLRSQNEI